MNATETPQARCPLCGSRESRGWVDGFIICGGCCEMLRPAELVRRSSWLTARRYRKANR